MKTHNLDSSMKKRSLKNLLVSDCMFPFKTKTTTISKTKSTKKITHLVKTHKRCIEDKKKNGRICATSLDKDGFMKTWAYCQTPKKKIVIKKPSTKAVKKPSTKATKAINPTKPIIATKTIKKPTTKVTKAIKAIKPTKKIIVKKKPVLNSVLVKELVLKELNLMKQGESFKKDRWRTLAYNKAIRAIKDYNGTFKSSKDVAHLKGVGEKILKKIDEIISTGKLRAANIVRKDKTIGAIEILSKIVAVGPVKAKELVEKHGIKSIKQLREKQNRILLNDKQLMGLKYYEDLLEKIPRNEMDKHKKVIEDVSKKLDSTMEVSVVGSYRRGVTSSGDIDILIRHPKDKNMLKPLVETLM